MKRSRKLKNKTGKFGTEIESKARKDSGQDGLRNRK